MTRGPDDTDDELTPRNHREAEGRPVEDFAPVGGESTPVPAVETVQVSLEEAGVTADPGNDADTLPDYAHDGHDVAEAADADPDDPFTLARPDDGAQRL